MSSKLPKWNDNETNKERLRHVYNFIDCLMFEMQDGTIKNMNVSLSIAFVKMAEQGEIDEVTVSEHADMFLPWTENGDYKIGNIRTYMTTTENEEKLMLYRCLQDHKGQADWTPDKVPALWKLIVVSKNGISYWSQPISQQDSYMLNDEVVNPDDDKVWVSDYDYNVWKPSVFGWHLKEE